MTSENPVAHEQYKKILQILEPATYIDRIPTVQQGEKQLAVALRNLMGRIFPTVEAIKTGATDNSKLRRNVILLMAPPGSGKTFFRQLIDNLLVTTYGQDFVENYTQNVTWEEQGEAGIRPHDPRGRFTEEELERANIQYEDSLLTSLHNSLVTVTEAPVTPAIQFDGQWVGRKLGAPAIYDLAKHQGKFVDTPPFNIHVLAFLRGPIIDVLNTFREEINLVGNNMERGRRLCNLFGVPIPKTPEDLQHLQQGASLELIEYIDDIQLALSEQYRSKNDIWFPGMENYRSIYFAQARDLAQLIPKDPYEILSDMYSQAMLIGRYLDYYIGGFLGIQHTPYNNSNPPIQGDSIFIGSNNPPVASLKIPDINKLKKHIRDVRQYGVKRVYKAI